MRAVRVGALHQEGDRGRLVEHAKFELAQRSGKIAGAAGDDNLAAAEARQQLVDGGDGVLVVDVVDDHQPAGMGCEPAERGGDLRRVLARVLFRQIENVRPGERGEARVERGRRVGAHEQQRRMLALMPQRVFDRQPRLADPAQPMQRPPDDRRRPARVGRQGLVQRIKVLLAALEEGAERGEGEIFRATRRSFGACFRQEIKNDAVGDLIGEIVWAGEGAAGIALERLQPRQMLGLRGARSVRRRIGWSPHGRVGGLGDQQRFAMIEREPRLPLCVGDVDAVAQRLAERRQVNDEIGTFRQQRLDVALERRRAGHVADEMHDAVAMRDIDVEFVERVAAEVDKVLLHLHFDVGPREVGAELIAIGAELVGHRREKDLHRFRHGRARRGLFPPSGCGMPERRPEARRRDDGVCDAALAGRGKRAVRDLGGGALEKPLATSRRHGRACPGHDDERGRRQ
ncbi:MAG: hypothetical protein ABSF67_09535 [Roseiarcus sp.]